MRTDDKAYKTLQAVAALEGFSCHKTTEGNIVLSRCSGSWIFSAVDKARAGLAEIIGEVQA